MGIGEKLGRMFSRSRDGSAAMASPFSLSVTASADAAARADRRKTAPLPSVFSIGNRAEGMPKPTPANLRKFAETPVARKAINTIKDRIACMAWRVQPRSGRSIREMENAEQRMRTLTELFERPNPDDSFRSLAEQVLEDVIVG